MNTFNFLNEILILFLYVGVILFSAIFIGWLSYSRFFANDFSLKDTLFNNKNLAIWFEFVGGFLIPIFFLISTLMKFNYHGKLKDLLSVTVYIIAYIVILSLFRYLTGKGIKLIGKFQLKQEVILNNEIFKEKNLSASLFSISTSVVVIGILLQENIFKESILSNIIRMGLVFLLTLGLLSVHKTLFYPKHSSLFKELFIDNNICAGILLLGHTVAINFIIFYTIKWAMLPPSGWTNILNVIDITLVICLIYFMMILFVSTMKLIINIVLKINTDNQLFIENNIGYSLLESSFYILLSIIIINGLLII